MGKVDLINLNETHKIVNLNNVGTNIYPLHGKKLALIFNHLEFTDTVRYTRRHGSENDIQRLQSTLKLWSFKVETMVDYKYADICEKLANLTSSYSEEFLSNIDCLMVIFLTYGEANDHLAAKDRLFSIYKISKLLRPDKLPVLAGKPKIIVSNASRGNRFDYGVTISSKTDNNGHSEISLPASTSTQPLEPVTAIYETEKLKTYLSSNSQFGYSGVIPTYADFLFIFSTFKDSFSFRNEKGAWFIQEFCDVLEKNQQNVVDFYDILTETIRMVALRRTDAIGAMDGLKQLPTFQTTLTKKLLFLSETTFLNLQNTKS